MKIKRLLALASLLTASFAVLAQQRSLEYILRPAVDSVQEYMSRKAVLPSRVVLDTVRLLSDNHLAIHLSRTIQDFPIRDTDVQHIEDILRSALPDEYKAFQISIFAGKEPLMRFSSAFFSQRPPHYRPPKDDKAWITPMNRLNTPSEGLAGYNIALWGGHGYYYSCTEDRWKWQRSSLFSTVEDLLPQSYIVGFLAPMLENAGATTLIPRERDTQQEEIIIDHEGPFYSEQGNWQDSPHPGFRYSATGYDSAQNPFSMGTARMAVCTPKTAASASYLPFFQHSGDYAVYISYQSLPESGTALYTVRYAGGEEVFEVNQRMGGGTWVYLGTYRFTKGESGQGVTVSSTREKAVLTTDAVRFGGGLGTILRGGRTSGYPKYAEAARYWLQWSGMPDSVFTPGNYRNDYRDDYTSRGLWVNYLKDSLHVPIDLVFALHTDAGSTTSDNYIGTLAIYKEENNKSLIYSNGMARITSRELADIVQTSIVDDIRSHYSPDWIRRGLWDRSYIEARIPDVPSVLVELLSHQNFADIRHALDPQFKFVVSRAAYKGILKYLSFISGTDYTVQPLSVRQMRATLLNRKANGATMHLQWTPQTDPLEASADPDGYIVYRRIYNPLDNSELGGFDTGTYVSGTEYKENITPGLIYSYKVVAVNKGGASFPSEVLSVGYQPSCPQVLIVNGFTDTSGPAEYRINDSTFAGFDFKKDHGIPYFKDISYIGEQYEFDRYEEWSHDDRPGFGASYSDYGPMTVVGNNFDYPLVHGTALLRSGYSFTSTSLGALMEAGSIDSKAYSATDFIFGKQDYIHKDDTLLKMIATYCDNGGSVFISGANIGKSTRYDSYKRYASDTLIHTLKQNLYASIKSLSSLRDKMDPTEASDLIIDSLTTILNGLIKSSEKDLRPAIRMHQQQEDMTYTIHRLSSETLKYEWSNGNASRNGQVRMVSDGNVFNFETLPNANTYCVESADALLSSDSKAFVMLRYHPEGTPAGIAYNGDYRCVSLGFPIEALTSQHQIDNLMREVMQFLLPEGSAD